MLAGHKNVAPLPPRAHAAGIRMSLHSRGDPRAATCQPIFTPGDLVWYQHPSGPWIAGRVVGLELHSHVPVYAVMTLDDGVRRLAQEVELQLRTSSQPSPASGIVSQCCILAVAVTSREQCLLTCPKSLC